MELQIELIRSGLTASGKSGKRPAIPDEELLEESKEALRKKAAARGPSEVRLVYASSTLRARQTAHLLYPNAPVAALNELRPMDLGVYDTMEYRDIAADKQFAQWGTRPELGAFSGGESPYVFQARCGRAFRKIVEEMASKGIGKAPVVTHRLVIVTILQRFCIPRSYYKDWEVPYGGGYVLLFDTMRNLGEIHEKL